LAAGGEVDTVEFGAQIGTVALTDQPQRILLAAENGVWLFDWSTLRAFPLASFPEHPAPPANASKQQPTKGVWRFNDGKASPTGTFVVGTTHVDEEYGKGLARVFEYFVSRESGQLNSKLIHEGVSISNGLDWEQGGNSMIYIDTPSGKVERFVWDASCSGESAENRSPMRDPTILITWPEAELKYADGMTLDAAGDLWIACWAAGRVVRYSPEGHRRTEGPYSAIPFPATQTTCTCFGGPELRDLYVTSAARDIDTSVQPLAGSLFVVQGAGQGRPAFEFNTTNLRIDEATAVQHKLKRQ
jgi:sugar lactone lactonase YvrE